MVEIGGVDCIFARNTYQRRRVLHSYVLDVIRAFGRPIHRRQMLQNGYNTNSPIRVGRHGGRNILIASGD